MADLSSEAEVPLLLLTELEIDTLPVSEHKDIVKVIKLVCESFMTVPELVLLLSEKLFPNFSAWF